MATDESFTDKQGQKQERVEWHHVVAFGKLAETCNEYLKKGQRRLPFWIRADNVPGVTRDNEDPDPCLAAGANHKLIKV